MGLFDAIRGEFIDIVEWIDNTKDTLVYRFERHDNEIKNNAKLTVREGQAAVFINEGQLADVFSPGMYTLNTQNLPILSTLKGWKYGFDSPFKAEVYFINMRNYTGQKWGTKNPITLSDPRFGMLEIRAFGSYVLKVVDPTLFIKEIVGTNGNFTTEDIASQLRSLIVTRFTDALGEANIPVEKYAASTNEISEQIKTLMSDDFKGYGVELVQFYIENVSMPDEVKKEIFELSRLNAIDIDKLTKLKAAKAIEKAAENESGAAGAGMGMGMGFAMANQMGQTMNPQPAQQGGATPPPLPTQVQFHVVVNGQQAGPYDMNGIQQLIAQNQINRDSLVWKQGMAAWTAAGQVSEINGLFGSVPPPIPQP